MTLRLFTASYRYPGTAGDRLDVTRVGCDRALEAGHPAPGLPFAPSSRILWPAKAHMDLVVALERRAAALPGSEAGAFVAVQAAELLVKTEAAYARLYAAEMRVSYGAHPDRDGPDELAARKAGVGPHHRAWNELLGREEATAVCFCPRREPGPEQRHTCHRHHLARFLVACGAVDGGERELPPPAREAKPRVAVPLEMLWAVSGARPPPAGSSRADRELHAEMLADVAATVRVQPPGTVVIHGGADGVDAAASRAARAAGLAEVVVRPWYDAWGDEAPLLRNVYVATAGRMTAWIAPWSRGTHRAVALARQAGVEVDERRVG